MATTLDEASENPLEPIIGKQLSAVVFVQDYVQLQFDGSGLTAVTLPTVEVGEKQLAWGMPGYRDLLCERIGKLVTAASVTEGQQIRIEFDDGSRIAISLKDEDYQTAEAAVFHNGPSKTWVW
jgi:hypothetical protein